MLLGDALHDGEAKAGAFGPGGHIGFDQPLPVFLGQPAAIVDDNHMHAVALHFMHYNFGRIHKTLRVTPAMEAGVSDHVWTLAEIAALVPEPVAKKRGPYKKHKKD